MTQTRTVVDVVKSGTTGGGSPAPLHPGISHAALPRVRGMVAIPLQIRQPSVAGSEIFEGFLRARKVLLQPSWGLSGVEVTLFVWKVDDWEFEKRAANVASTFDYEGPKGRLRSPAAPWRQRLRVELNAVGHCRWFRITTSFSES
jgi:hypothetical protein